MPIVLRDVSKAFGDKAVFDRFSLTLPDSGVVAVMGHSGSGKTTLANMLMGLTAPDSGAISGLEGLRFTAVFQEDRLIEGWSAARNIRLVCPRRVTDDEIRRHLAQVGLAGEADTPVRSLSGGMKRRVALVRAVLPEGDAMVLDEPFKGLDDDARRAAIDYVLTYAAGRLIVLISHDRTDAEAMGARTIVTIGAEGGQGER